MDLNYKKFGNGEPLVILHGLFGMLDNWLSLAKKFADNYEVFLIDQRNHGKSPHSHEHNYLLMARDLFDFFDQQNIFSANIIGHSMGGKTAMQFATLYPNYVKSLIIADIFPKEYNQITNEHQVVFNAINELKDCKFSDRKLAEKRLEELIPDKRILQFMYKNLTMSNSGCIQWKFNAEVLLKEYPALMKNIYFSSVVNVPVLFIKAEKSDYIIPDEFKLVRNYFPLAELTIMPEATHWLHADNPQLFLKIVLDFLIRINF